MKDLNTVESPVAEGAVASHTPGPWFVKPARTRLHIRAADHRFGAPGCYIGELAHGGGSAECAANAALIAAAPDLYEASEAALNVLLGCCVPMGGCDDRKHMLEAQAMLRAAIAKAEGK